MPKRYKYTYTVKSSPPQTFSSDWDRTLPHYAACEAAKDFYDKFYDTEVIQFPVEVKLSDYRGEIGTYSIDMELKPRFFEVGE